MRSSFSGRFGLTKRGWETKNERRFWAWKEKMRKNSDWRAKIVEREFRKRTKKNERLTWRWDKLGMKENWKPRKGFEKRMRW